VRGSRHPVSLRTATDETLVPFLVAGSDGGAVSAVKRLYAISDSGTVTSLHDSVGAADLQGKWLVFTVNSSNRFMALNLESGNAPFPLVESSSGDPYRGKVVGDTLAYTRSSEGVCMMSLTAANPVPTCGATLFGGPYVNWVAADATRVYATSASQAEAFAYDQNGAYLLTVYSDGLLFSPLVGTVLANGWLYSVASPSDYSWIGRRLMRYPATVGRLPQEILPKEWATHLFAVSKSDLYWAYSIASASTQQHIFSMPLPPQPCDAQLPCADTTKICGSSYCVAPQAGGAGTELTSPRSERVQ